MNLDKDGKFRFSWSYLASKYLSRKFILTAAFLTLAFIGVVRDPSQEWVRTVLIIAGILTGISMIGSQVLDFVDKQMSKVGSVEAKGVRVDLNGGADEKALGEN